MCLELPHSLSLAADKVLKRKHHDKLCIIYKSHRPVLSQVLLLLLLTTWDTWHHLCFPLTLSLAKLMKHTVCVCVKTSCSMNGIVSKLINFPFFPFGLASPSSSTFTIVLRHRWNGNHKLMVTGCFRRRSISSPRDSNVLSQQSSMQNKFVSF